MSLCYPVDPRSWWVVCCENFVYPDTFADTYNSLDLFNTCHLSVTHIKRRSIDCLHGRCFVFLYVIYKHSVWTGCGTWQSESEYVYCVQSWCCRCRVGMQTPTVDSSPSSDLIWPMLTATRRTEHWRWSAKTLGVSTWMTADKLKMIFDSERWHFLLFYYFWSGTFLAV